MVRWVTKKLSFDSAQ